MDDLHARIQSRRIGLGPEFELAAIVIRAERERERIARKYPAMPEAELDRRARISACFPKGWRERLANALEMAHSSMHPICQGRRWTRFDTATRFCALFPDVLAIEDLMESVPDGIHLHRCDLTVAAAA